MLNKAIRIVGFAGCVAVVCSGVYSMFHEHSRWSIPTFLFVTTACFYSAWRSRHNAIQF
jgi:hypothetical protein